MHLANSHEMGACGISYGFNFFAAAHEFWNLLAKKQKVQTQKSTATA